MSYTMSYTMSHLTILQKLGEETGEAVAVAVGGTVEAPVGYDTIPVPLPPSSIPSLVTPLLPAAHSSCGGQETPPVASVSLGLQSKSLVALII